MDSKSDSALIRNLSKAFALVPRPTQITRLQTREASRIERDFIDLEVGRMTYAQAASLIVDSALVTDEALVYFLPRLAQAALEEGGNCFMLRTRLDRFEKAILDEEQKQLIDALLRRLEECERWLEEQERQEVREGEAEWKWRLRAGGSVEEQLLIAVADGNIAEVKRLVSLGVDTSYKDFNGNTALSIARIYGNDEIVRLLSPLSEQR